MKASIIMYLFNSSLELVYSQTGRKKGSFLEPREAQALFGRSRYGTDRVDALHSPCSLLFLTESSITEGYSGNDNGRGRYNARHATTRERKVN